MTPALKLYLAFIRYSLDPDTQIPSSISDVDWDALFKFVCKQAIAGFVFEGVARLGNTDMKPPLNNLIQWIALSEQIEGQNKKLNKQSVEIVREYQEAGFQCCILKGQGNALMYPNPFSRTSGDIDLWVIPSDGKCKTEDIRRVVTQYVKKKHTENIEVRYYHVGYEYNGIEVEVHIMPNVMNNPFFHYRLQKWYKHRQTEQCKNMVELPEGVGAIPVPTVEFNIVFQLAHMMHHFFDEGIGLKQFIDYYYVLKTNKELNKQTAEETKSLLLYLGLWKFACAVMFVMCELFSLEKEYMIAPVDECRGKTLLNDILGGGNFGKYSGLANHSVAAKYFLKTKRNILFAIKYPSEALCEPIFRTWHFFWRHCH
jgi:hypothetical protein